MRVWSIFLLACGAASPPGSQASAVSEREAERLADACEVARGDQDCSDPSSSAGQCRSRGGASWGLCVDDLGNLCAPLGGPGGAACMFDQHCAGWELGLARCTAYGSLGPALCGVCQELE